MYDTLDYLWRLVREYADDPRYHNVALAFAAHLNAHEQALAGACCLWPVYTVSPDAAMRIVREIAVDDEPFVYRDGGYVESCKYCDGGTGNHYPVGYVQIGKHRWRGWHAPGCLWLRARQIVARLDRAA